MFTDALRARIEARFVLGQGGPHGFAHWGRVRDNGLLLCRHTGADLVVVELFAWLHDCCRENDGGDPGHGRRAAAFAEELRRAGELVLDEGAFGHLVAACTYHSNGRTEADPTVQVCWDADRLDLGRVGIQPARRYLCTQAAQREEIMAWTYARSVGRRPQRDLRDVSS